MLFSILTSSFPILVSNFLDSHLAVKATPVRILSGLVQVTASKCLKQSSLSSIKVPGALMKYSPPTVAA